MTTTDNELALLKAILNSEFHNGADVYQRVGNPVWVDCIQGFANQTKFGGTMASLTKKGLAGTDGQTCWITEPGFLAITFPVIA